MNQQISQKTTANLYALSLAIGSSLKLKENCEHFFTTFLSLYSLTKADLWVYPDPPAGVSQANHLMLAYSTSKERPESELLDAHHPLPQLLEQEPYLLHSGQGATYASFCTTAPEGLHLFYSLPQTGFLHIVFPSPVQESITQDLSHWRPLFNKFVRSLKACRQHERCLLQSQEHSGIEIAFRQRDAEFRGVLESLNEGLLISNQENHIIFGNQRIAQLSGYTLQEMLGKSAYEVFQPEGEPHEINQSFIECMQGKNGTYEMHALHKNGKRWWAKVNRTPYRDSEGTIIGTICLIADITIQKEAQKKQDELLEELGQSNKLLVNQKKYLSVINGFTSSLLEKKSAAQIIDLLIESARHYIVEASFRLYLKHSETGRFYLRATKEGGEFSTYDEQTSPGNFSIPVLVEEVACSRQLALVQDIQHSVWKESYAGKYNSVTIIPIKSAGIIYGAMEIMHPHAYAFSKEHIGIFETIGGQAAFKIRSTMQQELQLKTKQALKESELLNRLMIDTALDAVVLIDENGQVTNWNKQAEHTFGYSKEEAVGQALNKLIVPESMREAHEQGMKKYLETGHGPVLGKRIEISAIRRNGKEFPVELAITPIELGSRVLFSAFIRDITQRKQNETELIAARQHAEDSARTKEIFLANMSHEIRTPMNAITGMTRLLAQDPLTSRQSKYLQAIRSSSKNLLVIINDILDISKIEAGKLVLESLDFSLRELLDELKLIYQLKAESKHLMLHFTVDPAIPKALVGDPVRINQILVNLLGNAIKFTEKGSVHVRAMLHQPEGQSPQVLIEVQDTGIGIDKDKLNYVFKSFSQEDESTARKFGGTGLGLAISHQLADLMGGQILVESVKNTGTKFSLLFPMKLGDEQRLIVSEPEEVQVGAIDNMRILMAEDNHFNQMYAMAILEEHKACVTIVSDGKQAVEKLKNERFDLVLMDVQMPVMDGLAATQYIRNTLHDQTPIIALTANALKGHKEKYYEAGMNAYISKPFEPEALIAKIGEYAAHQKQPSTEIHRKATLRAESDTGELYNLSKLQMVTQGDMQAEKQLIDAFIAQTTEIIQELQEGMVNGHEEQVYQLVHKLKSSLDIMGMHSTFELVRDIEASKSKELEQNKPSLLMLIENCEAVIEELQKVTI